ncbi:ABC transporter substrate-binding protein [Pararhizobium haloflavum]|uniref:ABC transporter substrate-binding protein n=1 Tax=Pararhizobium haloflavum TaxID=2037914 RepID=UPI000C182733|nr:ABC transporter substrate-binding protein [Pararhizobium haloflavum]
MRHLLAAIVMMGAVLCAPASAQDAATIRIGVLQYGTVNWELDVIERHGLDEANGFDLQTLDLASNQATTVALQAGEVDMIVSDWLWVSRQRGRGEPYTFAPFSSSVGAIMVPPDSDISDLGDLAGKTIAVAGGPLDKGWLLLRALAERDHGVDLTRDAEPVFGAPPLLTEMARNGEVDAVLNYWHYGARLEAEGFRRLIGANDAAMALGAKGPISAIGWTFSEEWANDNSALVKRFFEASNAAKRILATSDEEWETLRPLTGAADHATLHALRDRFREGIPARPLSEEREDTETIYALLARIGGEELVGPATTMADGTFWSALTDGS